jgi:hypothetical protein
MDTRKYFDYFAGNRSQVLRARSWHQNDHSYGSRGLMPLFRVPSPAVAQQTLPPPPVARVLDQNWGTSLTQWRFPVQLESSLKPAISSGGAGMEFLRPKGAGLLLNKPSFFSAPDTIEKMEGAFYCNSRRLSIKCVCRWRHCGTGVCG